MDANKRAPVAAPQINNLTGNSNMSEMDRRRMIYKNVRKDISEQDAAAKQQAISRKMTDLEKKV